MAKRKNGVSLLKHISDDAEMLLGLKRKTSNKKKLPRVIKKAGKRSGKFKDIKKDWARKALKPGLRISESGKEYYENRRNRSDIKRL